MAKQVGIHQLRGKVGQMKYYGMKGVEGGLVQSINEGMSERVKTDAAYANTRLNNAEFGAAGSTAGAIIRSLTQKWRYLLIPFATGNAAKSVRALMQLDTTGKWGQRDLKGTEWQKILASEISALSKNEVEDYSDLTFIAEFNSEDGLLIGVEGGSSFTNEKLAALGISGVQIISLSGVVNASAFDNNSQAYAPAFADLKIVSASEVDFGDGFELAENRVDIKVAAQADNKLYGGVVIFLPYKIVNGSKYIMQEHCSFKMLAAE